MRGAPRQGPVEFLVRHPGARVASLAGAGSAAVYFALRAARARRAAKPGWIALAVLEAAIFGGILRATRAPRAADGCGCGAAGDGDVARTTGARAKG